MKNRVYLIGFIALAYLLYLPTIGAGFVTDFIGFLQRVETHGPEGFINSFGFPALQPVLNGFLISFYQLFGLNGLGWFLIFSGLHGLNSFLIFKLANRLSKKHLDDNGLFWPVIAGLIFLCSPYQSEPVVWKVCFNFLFSSFLMLSIFHFLLNYLDSRKSQWIYYSILSYSTALLTFELPLIFPLIIVTYLLFLHSDEFLNITKRFVLPMLLLVAVYFVANKIILQDWVGHYGADTHLNIDLKLMSQNAWKYTAKHLGFVRFYPHKYKSAIFGFCSKDIIFYSSLLLAFAFVGIAFYRRKKWTASAKLIGFSVIAFFLALAPMLNLFFYSLMYLENDRYGYFATAFLALVMIFSLKKIPKGMGVAIAVIYIGFSIHLLLKINNLWASSNRVVQGLLESYEWEGEEQVYLLNLPANMHGVYMFGDHSGNHQAFTPSLEYLAKKKPKGNVNEVIQYNLTNENNSATVVRDSLGNIKLELNHWGSWWWRENGGNKGYEVDEYNVEFNGRKFQLIPKKNLEEATFLIQDGNKWAEWNYKNN